MRITPAMMFFAVMVWASVWLILFAAIARLIDTIFTCC